MGALESNKLSKLSTNHNGALPGCTVHFDWLEVLKAGASVLPKNDLGFISDVKSEWENSFFFLAFSKYMKFTFLFSFANSQIRLLNFFKNSNRRKQKIYLGFSKNPATV